MTDDEYTSFVRALADKIDFRHYPDWGKRYAGVLDEGRHTVANEGAIHDKFVGNTLQDAVGLIMVLYHYRRAKGLPIDDLELPDLSGFFGGDEEAEPESEASIAAPDEIRNLMQEGESLSSAKRRLTELLWVEQAELRNLRGTDRENLKREAEIERLLGLFARLGEI